MWYKLFYENRRLAQHRHIMNINFHKPAMMILRFLHLFWKENGPAALCAMLSAVIALAPAIFELGQWSDHGFHQHLAAAWSVSGQAPAGLPHPVYHLLWMALHWLLGEQNLVFPGLIIYLGSYALVGILAYQLVTEHLFTPKADYQRWLVAVPMALIQFVAPVAVLTLSEQNLYIGYMHISTYHNPTTILLRPLALAQFLILLNSLRPARVKIPLLIGVAALSLVAVYTKPNYALALLPMLGIWVAYHGLRRQHLDWRIVLAMGIPTTLALLLQSIVMNDERGGIRVDPFAVLMMYSPDLGTAVLKIMMSSLFPLAVLLLFSRQVLRSAPNMLAWGIYLISLTQAILFTEIYQAPAGNFFWGAYVALLILFLTNLGTLLDALFRREGSAALHWMRVGGTSAVLLAHAAFGAFWWWLHLVSIWGGAGLMKDLWW